MDSSSLEQSVRGYVRVCVAASSVRGEEAGGRGSVVRWVGGCLGAGAKPSGLWSPTQTAPGTAPCLCFLTCKIKIKQY